MKWICAEYTKEDACVPHEVKEKLSEFLGYLDSWILGDPVLGDPSISTTITLLEVFIEQIKLFDADPQKLIDVYTIRNTHPNLKHGLE